MKISPSLLKAAIDRHNQRAKALLEIALESAEAEHLKKIGAPAFTKELRKLNERWLALNKQVSALGLNLCGVESEEGNVTVELAYRAKHTWQEAAKAKIEALDSRCRETTVMTVLLAAAASGSDDVAAVLDDLKLNWRDDGK